MKIFAIETSCDETAIALVEAKGGLNHSTGSGPKFRILENLVASQIKIHRPFGGIVPNLAKREHLKNLPILLKKLLTSNFYILNSVDIIAVTMGPGLEPCLWTGINFAKNLYADLRGSKRGTTRKNKLEIVGVNHLEGHLYSFLLSQKRVNPKSKILNLKQKGLEFRVSSLEFPAVHLLVSGGHTILLLMKDLTHYKKLGETRDDAVGEAFDKVARLLGLPYPGGPEIEKLAKYGSSTSIDFPRPMMNQKNYDFSFSGLKTAVLYYLKESENLPLRKGEVNLSDIAASFQQAAFDVLISKTLRAVKEFNAKSIMISGGVAANKTLKKEFMSKVKSQMSNVNFLAPPKNFCADNAAMIAVAGYINYSRKKNRRLIANGNLGL